MQDFTQADYRHMARALELAQRGRYSTSPNPRVGCVIVDGHGDVVGEGWHQRSGQAHAEVFALAEAGQRAFGGTAYVTLEPCSHHGRTPPCADALIKAGVKRVVAAMTDPYDEVDGNGLAKLRAAGIEVQSNLLFEQARRLNRGFVKRVEKGRPFVTLKLAASLDGKTALANGDSKWITGIQARQDVQHLRAEHCAVLTTAETVIRDNACLNVRLSTQDLGEHYPPQLGVRQPLRIVIDSRNRLIPELALFGTPGDILIVNKSTNPGRFGDNVRQWQCQSHEPRVDLEALLAHLAKLPVNQLWVEAGRRLAGALFAGQWVDELVLYQAPALMGNQAQGLMEMPELTAMAQVPRLSFRDMRRVGPDLRLTLTPHYRED